MGKKLGTDDYLAKFDKYGNGKTKVKKGDKKIKAKSKKGDAKKGSDKLVKQLTKRVVALETGAAMTATVSSDAIKAASEAQNAVLSLAAKIEFLEKNQKAMNSQIKSLGKAQKAMKEDIKEVAEEVADAPSE